MTDLLEKAKVALGQTTDAYDGNLLDLIDSAKQDLGISGVVLPDELDAICEQAILTYVKLHFAAMPEWEFKATQEMYNQQLSKLSMATGYTDWSD